MALLGKRIFIVEDNALNRAIFQLALITHGASLEFERWGKDAVARLQQVQKVDLIILDLMLHNRVSGYDIFDDIRKLPDYANIPIVAVSAAESTSAMHKTREKGFAGFIGKPIDDILFPQQIEHILNGQQIWYVPTQFRA